MSENISFLHKLKARLQPFRHFPVTLSTIWLFTLILTFGLFAETLPVSDFLEQFTLILFYFGTGSFFVESLFLHRERKKWYYLALAADLCLSVFFFCISPFYRLNFWVFDNRTAYFFRYTISYFLILFFLSIWLCYKNLSYTFEEYITLVFGKAVRYNLLWALMTIGSTLIINIIETLFHLDWDFYIQVQMLLFGFYYMSCFLLSFYPEDDTERGTLTAILVKYVCSGMVLIAFGVIYAYMLKILILQEIPSNEIFRITGQLFILGMPVCLMSCCYRENHPLLPFIRRLPYFFLPFLPLQIYSIVVRIWKNGITPMRYAAVALLLFECTFFALWHFRRDKLHLLPLCLSALILTGGCLPYINMNYVSFLSQKSAVERFLAMTPQEQKRLLDLPLSYDDSEESSAYRQLYSRVRGAYLFLSYEYTGEQYLDSLTQEQTALLDTLLNQEEDFEHAEKHYHVSASTDVIPVEGYQRCYLIEVSSHRDEFYDQQDNAAQKTYLSHYPLILHEEPLRTLTIDLDALLRAYTIYENGTQESQRYFESHQLYEIDETHTLYLGTLSFTMNTNADTDMNAFSSYRLEGYLLEKQ